MSEKEKFSDILNKLNFKDGEHLNEMFLNYAKGIADTFAGEKKEIKSTQFRKFYDRVLELNDKAKSLDENEFKVKILPFVKMLISKSIYAKNRGVAGEKFVKLMQISISKVNSKEELQNFKYFLEAIIGFMPKK